MRCLALAVLRQHVAVTLTLALTLVNITITDYFLGILPSAVCAWCMIQRRRDESSLIYSRPCYITPAVTVWPTWKITLWDL